ncbi:MAG TPA: hypothetical protein V6D17_09330 [Candidatus Obscuribacterales bacterium]
MKTTRLLFILSSTLAACAHLLPAVADDLAQGYAAYQKGDYKQAAQLLSLAAAGPAAADPRAHYMLANSYLQLGASAKAVYHYRAAIQLKAPEPLLTYARQGLQRLGQTLVREAQTRSDTSSRISSSMQVSAEAQGRAASPEAPVTLSAEDQKLLKVHRQTGETNEIKNLIARSLVAVPLGVKNTLISNGIKIVITPTIPELDPQASKNKPRGYIHGGGYDNCPGYYSPSEKQIVIPERVSYRSAPPRLNDSADETMLHEMGHAFDNARGDISAREAFKQIYEEETSRLSNTAKTKYYYYTQGGDTGPSELFAELFATACSHRAGIQPRQPGLETHYPKCSEYVQQFVK